MAAKLFECENCNKKVPTASHKTLMTMRKCSLFPPLFLWKNIMCMQHAHTFPKTGAIPIITEAKAERTCWEESEDNSWK